MTSWFSSITPVSESLSDTTLRSTESSIALSTHYTVANTIRQQFVPMNGSQYTVNPQERAELLKFIGGIETKIKTRDGASLDAVWSPSKTANTSPTVMIFHGNGCILDNMVDYAKWYKDRGLNVLLVTMRGYPGSTGDAAKAGEMGWYLDAEGCVRFALDKGVQRDRLFSHGYSLGGVLAAAAMHFFRLPGTLDHTLINALAMMRQIADQSIVLPQFVTQGISKGTFPHGITDTFPENERVPGSLPMKTDGLNSLEKLRASDRPFFIMYGRDDALMPVDFAMQFLQARCGLNPTERDRREHLAEIPGGHWGPFMKYPETSRQYERYLLANKLMDPK